MTLDTKGTNGEAMRKSMGALGDVVRRSSRVSFLAWLTASLAGCGGDEASVVPLDDAAAEVAGTEAMELAPEELYGATPVENLWSPRFELPVTDLPAGWNGARLAILSDFHLGVWEGNEQVARAAVEHAVAARPQAILLLGDYIGEGADVGALARVLAPLRGTRAVAVLGDHDIRSDSLAADISRTLEENGVTVLRNSSTALAIGPDTLRIAGLDPEILRDTWAEQEYILAVVGGGGDIPILLTHTPPLVTRAPTGRFDIVIGANTFCGTVEVPGTPRLSWLRDEVFPQAGVEGTDRLYRVAGSTVLVTCGVGFGYVPLRFGAPPEVPILTLVGSNLPAEGEAADSVRADTTGAPGTDSGG